MACSVSVIQLYFLYSHYMYTVQGRECDCPINDDWFCCAIYSDSCCLGGVGKKSTIDGNFIITNTNLLFSYSCHNTLSAKVIAKSAFFV